MADQPIKLFGHEIKNGFITGLTEGGAHITAAVKKQVGNVVHTTEHVFHLEHKVSPAAPAVKTPAAAAEVAVTPKAP